MLWVPKKVTCKKKINASQKMLGLAAYCEAESDDFIGCILTGKKLCCSTSIA
jgi:hypothetical protein